MFCQQGNCHRKIVIQPQWYAHLWIESFPKSEQKISQMTDDNQGKDKITMGEKERITWQKPDTPAMDSKLKALARKLSSVVGSVCSFGGGPGTVGSTRTPES